MSSIRPEGATHTDGAGKYFKPDVFTDDWMLYQPENGHWACAGPMLHVAMIPLQPVQVVQLEKFDAPMAPTLPENYVPPALAPSLSASACEDTFCIRERLIGSKFCLLHGAAPAPALQPSDAHKWDHPGFPSSPSNPSAPFTNYFIKYQFVGSRITCNPPPLDTDQDVLVLVHQNNHAVMERKILEAGFIKEGSLPADIAIDAAACNVFHSYRKGDMNYIVTTDEAFYQRFSTATELARKYNLMEKSDRIQLFQAVLYGKWWA